MSRASLRGMPTVSIQDGDPFTEHVLHLDLERLLDYHLHVDVENLSDEATDRLDDMWPIHRDRWLGQYGLQASLEPNKRGDEQLVIRDDHMHVAARVPSGLTPSVERTWLQANPSLKGVRQTVDERFDENIALFPELKPVSSESTRQSRISRIAVSVAAFAMMHFGRK